MFESTGFISKRTRPSSATSGSPGESTAPTPASLTSTAAGHRWPRSSPNPTSTPPKRLRICSPCCGYYAAARGQRRQYGGGLAPRDANVSFRPVGSERARHKDRLKNMNSFRFLLRGVNAEIARQAAISRPAGRSCRRHSTSTPAGNISLAAIKGGGTRLPLLPRARPLPLLQQRKWLPRPGRNSPNFPRRVPSGSRPISACTPTAPGTSRFARSSPTTTRRGLASGDGGSAADPVELANWIPLLVEQIGSDTDPATTRVSPAALAQLAAMVGAKAVSRDAARHGAQAARRRGRQRLGPLVEREGLGALESRRRSGLSADGRRRDRGAIRMRRPRWPRGT